MLEKIESFIISDIINGFVKEVIQGFLKEILINHVFVGEALALPFNINELNVRLKPHLQLFRASLKKQEPKLKDFRYEK